MVDQQAPKTKGLLKLHISALDHPAHYGTILRRNTIAFTKMTNTSLQTRGLFWKNPTENVIWEWEH